MFRLPSRQSRTRAAWRRVTAVALLALQVALVLAPLGEQRSEVRRDSHIESLGSRHLFAHDEATCTVCSVRSLVGDVPKGPVPLFVEREAGVVEYAAAGDLTSAALTTGNPSRAPPTAA